MASSDVTTLTLRFGTTHEPMAVSPTSTNMALPAGDWIRVELSSPISKTESRIGR